MLPAAAHTMRAPAAAWCVQCAGSFWQMKDRPFNNQLTRLFEALYTETSQKGVAPGLFNTFNRVFNNAFLASPYTCRNMQGETVYIMKNFSMKILVKVLKGQRALDKRWGWGVVASGAARNWR